MSRTLALRFIFGVSLFGLVFSGVLSYQELFGNAVLTCPSPGPRGTVLGYPACVYGFFMYLVIAAVSGWSLLSARLARRARQRMA
jgi:hypothetical protein